MKKFYTLIIGLIGISAIGAAQCTITSGPTITPTGLTINFTATGTGAVVPAYIWDFGDQTTPAFSQSGTHTYTTAGTYSVCVVYGDITDTTCNDFSCSTITVAPVGIQEANSGVNTISTSPNPFGASTTFNVNLASSSNVEISVYDVTGKRVETVQNGEMVAGQHNIVWAPENLVGGVYFVQMIVDGAVTTKRIVHTSAR